MDSANDALMDAAIDHQVALQRYSNGVVRRLMAILNRSDARLFAELQAALDRLDPASFTVERLEAMLGAVRALNAQAYAQVGAELRQELRDFVAYEASYQQQVLASVLPLHVHVAAVPVEVVYAAALARPFQGMLLAGVLGDLEAGKAKQIRQAIALGFTEGRTTAQIVRELRGTRAKGYSDGIIEISRRNAEAVVRTAIGHTAGFVRDRFFEGNAELIRAIAWTATLDSRTSETCRVRDGKRYTAEGHRPIGHSLPWLAGPGRAHWNCRSTGVPVLKSYRELGIPIEDFTPAQRASLDGQVPAATTYGQWLARQSAARQDDVLGPTRGKLFRAGGLPLERFYNDKGRYLTLEQLRERDAAAFRRAGV
jgi:hypothetical protein